MIKLNAGQLKYALDIFATHVAVDPISKAHRFYRGVNRVTGDYMYRSPTGSGWVKNVGLPYNCSVFDLQNIDFQPLFRSGEYLVFPLHSSLIGRKVVFNGYAKRGTHKYKEGNEYTIEEYAGGGIGPLDENGYIPTPNCYNSYVFTLKGES